MLEDGMWGAGFYFNDDQAMLYTTHLPETSLRTVLISLLISLTYPDICELVGRGFPECAYDAPSSGD